MQRVRVVFALKLFFTFTTRTSLFKFTLYLSLPYSNFYHVDDDDSHFHARRYLPLPRAFAPLPRLPNCPLAVRALHSAIRAPDEDSATECLWNLTDAHITLHTYSMVKVCLYHIKIKRLSNFDVGDFTPWTPAFNAEHARIVEPQARMRVLLELGRIPKAHLDAGGGQALAGVAKSWCRWPGNGERRRTA